MSTTGEIGQAERHSHMARLREAVDYLQLTDPEDLTPTEYAEIEEAILKVWVWVKLRGYFDEAVPRIAADTRYYLDDLTQITHEVSHNVARGRSRRYKQSTHGFARSRSASDFGNIGE